MNDLLPLNATPQERSVSLATARVGSVPTDPVRYQWNPWLCPVASLPWLAWALSVSPWNPDWAESQKRAAIASSVGIHRIKGTIGGVRQALKSLGYECVVTENAGAPYVFNVQLTASSQNGDIATILTDATTVILQAKNARSKLGTVSLAVNSPGVMYAGLAAVTGSEVSVFPQGYGS